jgi:hypothetical protein
VDGLPVNIPVLSYIRCKYRYDGIWKIWSPCDRAFKCLARRGR